MTKSEKALEYFYDGYNCSQSVLTAFATELNLTKNDCLKVSCAFGGGMGRQQMTCGAVTGALMALGLKYGKAFGEDDSKKIETYAKTVEFLKTFEKEHNSVVCKDLLNGLDMNTEEGQNKIMELNLFRVNCDRYVADAVVILESILQD